MRILFIVSSFPALSETFILNRITGLLDLGHYVEIFARFNPNEKKIHNDVKKYQLMKRVRYFNIPNNKLKRIFKAVYLVVTNFSKSPIKVLKSLNIFKYGKAALTLELLYTLIPFLYKKFDIIHCHFGPNGQVFMEIKKILGIDLKYITSMYGYDLSIYLKKYGSNIYHDLYKDCDLFLPVSDSFRKRLVETSCDKEKVIVLRTGVDLNRFCFRARHLPSGGKVKILTTARLVEKKGIDYAIKAVAKLILRYPNLEYKIAGDGFLKGKLQSLIGELNIRENVILLGPQDKNTVIKLMEEAHIFLLPSATSQEGDEETIPQSLIEAVATGLPIISTFHGGIPELVQNGKSGFLAPERDVNALASKLEYLIEHPKIWAKMGRVGRRFVGEHHDIKKSNQRLVKIYEALLSGENRRNSHSI